jgi:hypothetical protein
MMNGPSMKGTGHVIVSVFQILVIHGGLGCGGEDFYCVVFS